MKQICLSLLMYSVLFPQDNGLKFYNDKKYDDARNFYQEVIDNRKNDLSAQYGLGVTAYKQESIGEAVTIFNRLKNVSDKEIASKAFYNLGNIYREQNQFEQSMKSYKKAIELNPNDYDSKVNYELLTQQFREENNEEQNSDDQQQGQEDNEEQNSDDQQQGQQDNEEQNSDDQQQGQQDNEEQNSDDQQQGQQDNEEQNSDEQQDGQGDENNQNLENQQQQTEKEDQIKNNAEQKEKIKTDQIVQAEAILNAIKDQEKINQKQQIKKSKTIKLEKDW